VCPTVTALFADQCNRVSKFSLGALMCKNGSVEGLSVQAVAIDEKCHILLLKYPSTLVPVLQSLLQF
jgi:hypothetical protein